MPRLDLLIFPLLGGYLFLITFTITKFYHQRIEKQRLIFNSLIAAFLLCVIALILDNFVLNHKFIVEFRNSLVKLNPFGKLEYLNLSIFIFLVSLPFAWLINLFIPTKLSLWYVVERWGNQMEKQFWNSLNSVSDIDKLLMITTKSNKVYIAYVNEISEPIGDSYVTLIPNVSGYRDKDTQELKITTDYLSILEHYINQDQPELIDKKLGITIPVSEISMVSKFDDEIFTRFEGEDNEHEGNVDE